MGSQSFGGVFAARSWARKPVQIAMGMVAAAALLIGYQVATPPPAAAVGTLAAEEIVAQDLEAAVEPVHSLSADPLPTVQINGIVYAQAVAGNRVFAGGEFTQARPAGAVVGSQQTPRSNLLAYNLQTGVLDGSFAPQVNGRIMAAAVSPDGATLYIGGAFTSVNGQSRFRLAAFNTATGALLNWQPGTNSAVFGLAATSSTVYIAGQYSTVNNTTRTGVAAVTASTGALLPFNPVHEGGYLARAIVVAPDGSKVIAAGSFLTTNGQSNPGRGMAALDATTGASLPWAVNSVLHNGGNNAAIYALSSDATSVYGSGYDFGGSRTLDGFEGAFRASWDDGTMVWMQDCHGDTYSVAPHNGTVYTATHSHYCGNIGEFPQLDPWAFNHSLAFAAEPSGRAITPDVHGYRSFTGNPAAKLLHWYPTWTAGTYSGLNQAGWSVTSAGDYVLYGGEFTAINGTRQQGLVRFATRDIAPEKVGPRVQGGAWTLNALSVEPGEARLLWQANHDPDNAQLTYELFRRNVTAPLHTETVASTYWVRPTMRFIDTAVQQGQTYDYRVRATDADGNSTQSDWTSVTIASPGAPPAYLQEVLDDSPRHYWPLGEPRGMAAADWAGGDDLILTETTTRTPDGQALDGSTDATVFAGTSSSYGSSTIAQPAPQEYSVEAWFNTTSTRGGKIVGFGDSTTSSTMYDRQIYISGNGTVSFGNRVGQTRVVQSGAGFNDGQWHHVVGTLGAGGMTLWVDGLEVGARADTTTADAYSGYWRVGGDTLRSWPNVNGTHLAGTIADVAVYDRVLTRADVDAHRTASGRDSRLPSVPADAYGAAVYDLDPTLYWRLGEPSGTVAIDAGPDGLNGTFVRAGTAPFQYGQSGALVGVADTAVGFASSKSATGSWTNRQAVVSTRSMPSPTTFAVETWFRTTSTSGGKLVGFGSSSTVNVNASSSHDRHVMMTPDGRLQFGVWNGSARVLDTAGTYNDGTWHHVVGQQSAAGMQLYVDGELVGSNDVTTANPYVGYWRIAGDTTWVGDPFWVGTLDEVAVYAAPLAAGQVRNHFELGTGGGDTNRAPTAAFTPTVTGLALAVDASASTDPEGPIASYAWEFGDGATATGATAQHTYAADGIYTVTLTVTDAAGATATAVRQVTAAAPNAAPTSSFTVSSDGLTVSVDGSGSTDPDGSIASYAWSFGGGATGTGATATHTYPTSGTRTVSLTVTDDRGATATSSQQVTVSALNQAPTASFSVSSEGLSISVDGSGSTDPDGTIASYAWSFGGGATGTGATATHTYPTSGTRTVSLTVTDDRGVTATSSQEVTVTAANQAPTASFTVTREGMTVSVDGSASSDADGTIASHAWTFGDGATATGATASHTYTADGTRTITLTVVDDAGASASTTRTVTVEQQVPAAVLARDTFTRSATGAWGTPDVGPAWTPFYGAAAFSVANGQGVMALAPSHTREARMSTLTRTDAELEVSFSSDVASAGAAASMTVIGRQIASSVYATRVRLEPGGTVRVYLLYNETSLGSFVLPQSYTPGAVVHVRMLVDGTSPTRLAASVWLDGTTEPAAWMLDTTHTVAAMQAAGYVGVRGALSSASTVPVQTFRFDDWQVRSVGAAPAPNAAPTSSFTVSPDGLAISVDGSGSTDPDGSIASYAWSFGGGATGTGATATHTYPTSGTRTVSLTVTDDDGATATSSQQVTVTAAPAENQAPTASFTVTPDGLAIAVDGSGSTDPDGSIASYAWSFGGGATGTGATATHTYPSSGTRTVSLTVTDDDGATATSSQQVTVTAAPAENRAPTASFTVTPDGLAIAVDGSGSTDPDGSIASYAWSFGGGATGTGATATHTYPSSGTRTVSLTVTDDRGATATSSQQVTVEQDAPAEALARDTFTRSATGSWGTPDVGPAWTTFYGNAAFSVAGDQGRMALSPSHTREARMTTLSQTDAELEVSFSSDVVSAGGGAASVTVIGRQVGSSNYATRVRLEPSGTVRVYLLYNETALGSFVLPQSYTAGAVVHVRMLVDGTSPTRLASSVWLDGTTEPAAWMLDTTHTVAAMQTAGYVAVRGALSSTSTVPVQTIRFDDWEVRAVG
ncbi:MAG: PKD domain-containing protein [Actinomycetota bacterium]